MGTEGRMKVSRVNGEIGEQENVGQNCVCVEIYGKVINKYRNTANTGSLLRKKSHILLTHINVII